VEERIELDQEVINQVEKDLKCYPDWIVRLEVSGLGITSRATLTGGCSTPSLASLVERDAELSDEIKKKVVAIEKVYDRLHGKTKDLIEYRYFQGYGRDAVRKMISNTGELFNKKSYYTYRDRALECFARALGYID